MKPFRQIMAENYRKCLEQPIVIIVMVLGLCVLAGYYARSFTFDASSDTLIAEHDPELAYFREVSRKFGDAPFLVLTYTPERGKLLIPRHLKILKQLEARLLAVPGVKSVSSILDVPLLQSPPISLGSMGKDLKTLRDSGVDLDLAAAELTTSPLFKELVISTDGRTTALRIDLFEDYALESVRQQRVSLRSLPDANDESLARVEHEYTRLKEALKVSRSKLIQEIRDIRDQFSAAATLYLGGVPMISADMVGFVEQDMQTFGVGLWILVAAALYGFFRRLRWVLIPLGSMSVTLLLLVGLLGFLNQPATAISANFVSLIAIITISFTVHLIVRYMELRHQNFSDNHTDLVYEAMRSKLAPSLYTGLTTGVAFASLLTSDIVPVIDFGWIMCVGIVISFFVTYSFFASVLVLLPKGAPSATIGSSPPLTRWMAYLSIHYSNGLLGLATASAVVACIGINLLSLDNRFTEYFRHGTEIRDGMEFIDSELGGTIPLDVILTFPPFEKLSDEASDDFGDEFTDDFSDVDGAVEDVFPEKYWFTPQKLAVLEKMQAYLESRPELGKSISASSVEKVGRAFNDGEALDYLQLVSVLSVMPEEVRSSLIYPYASPSSGELRISTRVHETGPAFSRDALISDIKNYAKNELGLQAQDVHVTGMAVLFNSMLNQLLDSQTSTLMFVLLATFVMFVLLLRSAKLAVIGLIPNVLAAMSILAFMGFAGIPLDMMTISIAAIVIGIGVDDAIHYLHRFKEQKELGDRTVEAIKSSHASIGHALYYTSITVVVGFGILSFSNFIPTVYFGLLTAMAMLLALAANLIVLPSLLLKAYR